MHQDQNYLEARHFSGISAPVLQPFPVLGSTVDKTPGIWHVNSAVASPLIKSVREQAQILWRGFLSALATNATARLPSVASK